MSPFEVLFSLKPRTSLENLVPQTDDTDIIGSLDSFEKERRQGLREVWSVLEKRYHDRFTS